MQDYILLACMKSSIVAWPNSRVQCKSNILSSEGLSGEDIALLVSFESIFIFSCFFVC